MKLEYHCDPEINDHKKCSGKVIEDEKTSPCECSCHTVTESEFLMATGRVPRGFPGFPGGF